MTTNPLVKVISIKPLAIYTRYKQCYNSNLLCFSLLTIYIDMASSSIIKYVECLVILMSIIFSSSFVESSRFKFFAMKPENVNILASRRFRTAYHFQPLRNWINDPNGPMYHKGIYHFFYQYNPYAAVWGNISWGHSVSTDLIHWTGLPPALVPSGPYDINGCFSGSATILPGKKPVIVYTGMDSNNRQVQNIAFPKNESDPYLREWVKPDYNPIMEPVDGLNSSQFRDPSTAWIGHDGQWRLTVGAEIGLKGLALLYKSQDFVHWARVKEPLYATNGSRMWECPDFFSVGDGKGKKYVLKVSLIDTQSDHYMLGSYDEVNDRFVPDKDVIDDYRMWRRYDYGNIYASKSFFDEKKQRRISWGWSNESDTAQDDVAKGWSGIQTFPRVISLDTSGKQLLQWPIEEIESLRRKPKSLKNTVLKTGSFIKIKGISGYEADIEVEFELLNLNSAEPFDASYELDPSKLCGESRYSTKGGIGSFGLIVLASNHKMEEYTAIFFRVYQYKGSYKLLMCSDQRGSSLRPEVYKPTYGAFIDDDININRKISLRTLIDHSIVESFGQGGKACIAARVYPTMLAKGKSSTYVFNAGSETIKIRKLKAWSLIRPKIS